MTIGILYVVFSRAKNSATGSPVAGGKPFMATSAEAACDKAKVQHKSLRRQRLFARPLKQLELEREARQKALFKDIPNPEPLTVEMPHET